jgi:hypothetical protein
LAEDYKRVTLQACRSGHGISPKKSRILWGCGFFVEVLKQV